jgi:hypothetical protein
VALDHDARAAETEYLDLCRAAGRDLFDLCQRQPTPWVVDVDQTKENYILGFT